MRGQENLHIASVSFLLKDLSPDIFLFLGYNYLLQAGVSAILFEGKQEKRKRGDIT